MNPIEKQNRMNLKSRPWHLRLSAVLGSIRRAIAWWFADGEGEARQLWRTRLHLERCWVLDMQSVDLLGIDQREW